MKSTLSVLLFVFSLTSAVVFPEEDLSPSSINCRSRNFATGMDAIVRCDIAVEEYDLSISSSSLPSIHPFQELTRYPTCVFIQTKTQKYQSCIQLNKIAQTDCKERCIPRSKMIGKSEGTYCCCTSDMCNEDHNVLS